MALLTGSRRGDVTEKVLVFLTWMTLDVIGSSSSALIVDRLALEYSRCQRHALDRRVSVRCTLMVPAAHLRPVMTTVAVQRMSTYTVIEAPLSPTSTLSGHYGVGLYVRKRTLHPIPPGWHSVRALEFQVRPATDLISSNFPK